MGAVPPGVPPCPQIPHSHIPCPQEDGYARVLRRQAEQTLQGSRMVAVCQYNSMAEEDLATLRHFLRRHNIHLHFVLNEVGGGSSCFGKNKAAYPGGPRAIPVVPGLSWWFQGYPTGSRAIPLAPGVSQRLQGCPGGSRAVPVAPGLSRLSQCYSQWSQGYPGVPRAILVFPGLSRLSQGCPGP